LNVEAARAVFVGDDPRTDMEGAAAVGMKTIHMMSYVGEDEHCGAPGCRIHVRRLNLIPAIAEQLVPARMESHVA
jgi:FMN phosphatase YigB (HAD superfamily)